MDKREILLGIKAFLSNFNYLQYPYKLNFSITYQCNGRCKNCEIWKKYIDNPNKLKEELKLSEIEKIFEKYSLFSWVSLTGGEPFLRNDVIKIVETIKEKSKNFYLLNIPTNGLLTDKTVKSVEKISDIVPRIIVTVSIDGLEDIHDKLRGKGNWRKAFRTYKKLKELSEKKKNLGVYIGYTLSPFNINSNSLFFEKIDELGISYDDIHLNLFHKTDYYGNLNLSYNRDDFRKKASKELENIISKKSIKLSEVSYLERKYIKLLLKYIRNNKTPLSCKAHQASIFIDPYGNVYPCITFKKNLGNLRKYNYDLKKIISNSIHIRKDIEKLKCPNCWTPCEAYQTILGNFFKSLVSEI